MVEPGTNPATVRKLADHFTGGLPFVIHGRTRSSGGVDSRAKSGEINGGPSAFSGICRKGWPTREIQVSLRDPAVVPGVKPLPKEDDSKTPKKGKKCVASHTGRQWGL